MGRRVQSARHPLLHGMLQLTHSQLIHGREGSCQETSREWAGAHSLGDVPFPTCGFWSCSSDLALVSCMGVKNREGKQVPAFKLAEPNFESGKINNLLILFRARPKSSHW